MISEANSLSLTDLGGLSISFAMFAFAFVIQVILLHRLDPQTLRGDELEYWRKAIREPSGCVWVRVPLGAAAFWIAHRITKTHAIRVARLIMSLVSAISVGLVSWYAYKLAGIGGGLIAGFLILISVERAILAIHLWPDILLGLWLLLFSEILRGASSLSDMALLGLVAALGFLTRVDFTVLAVFGAIFAVFHATDPLPAAGLVICPTLIAAVAVTLFNGKTHGVWAPDTTFQFNIAVATTEAKYPEAATDELMRKTSGTFKANRLSQAPSKAGAPRGWVKLAALALRRAVTLLGVETFVRHKLINPDMTPYAQVPKQWLRWPTLLNLKLWFSVLCVAFVLFANGIATEIQLIVLALVFTQSAVQARSRYRMSLLPVLAVNVAVAIGHDGLDHVTLNSVLTSLFLAGLLIFIRPRDETSSAKHPRRAKG